MEKKAIGANVRTRLQSWLNDCFFSLTSGIDWANLLGQPGRQSDLTRELQTAILATDGVLSIDDLSIEISDRRASVRYRINTIYSQEMSDLVSVGGQP